MATKAIESERPVVAPVGGRSANVDAGTVKVLATAGVRQKKPPEFLVFWSVLPPAIRTTCDASPPVQFSVTPFERLITPICDWLVHVIGEGQVKVVANAPTSDPPGPEMVNDPPSRKGSICGASGRGR